MLSQRSGSDWSFAMRLSRTRHRVDVRFDPWVNTVSAPTCQTPTNALHTPEPACTSAARLTTPAVAAHYGSHPIAATRYGDVAPLQLPARPRAYHISRADCTAAIATLPRVGEVGHARVGSAPAQAVRDFPQLTVVINYPQ
ncbi:hypothetical protein B0H10DRAFT_2217640 [Mycena sp. CBHHK59/15]|nr:hypothetical protein B0H10DRAFT_2217640 [Mycena sp. CBHHK59/15]